MRRPGRPRGGIADMAFDVTGGDPLAALLLVLELELIWSGRLTVGRDGYHMPEPERIAA